MPEPRTGEKLVRPRQVTLAGWMIVIGSVGVVLTVFTQVASLNSLETTRALEETLNQPPASGLGVSVGDARLALRISAMVAGACAAAAAILGWQVLQRSRSARVALAVLALPLFVTGVASGGLLSSVVVASAVMLWLQPARDWFDGRQPSQPARPTRPDDPQRALGRPAPTGASVPARPGPEGGPDRPTAPHDVPLAVSPAPLHHIGPPDALRPGDRASPDALRRPTQVVWACVLTWVGSGLVAGLLGLSVLALLAAPDALFDEITRQNPDVATRGLTLADVRLAAIVSAVVVVTWSAVAAALAALVWRGVSWAHVALVVSAVVAGVLSLLGVLLNPLLVVPLAVCAATAVLLLRAEVRWWLRARAQPVTPDPPR